MTSDPIKAKYYNGEAEFPYKKFRNNQYANVYWNAERMYLNHEDTAGPLRLAVGCGLAAATLQIPLALVAFMFEMFCHYSDDAPEYLAPIFRNAVLPNYLA